MTAGDEQKPELEKLDKIDVVVVKDGVCASPLLPTLRQLRPADGFGPGLATTLKVRPTTKFDKIFTAIEVSAWAGVRCSVWLMH